MPALPAMTFGYCIRYNNIIIHIGPLIDMGTSLLRAALVSGLLREVDDGPMTKPRDGVGSIFGPHERRLSKRWPEEFEYAN